VVSAVINEDVDLAKAGSVEGSCSHEIMGLGQEEPSFDYAQRSHSRRCDSVSHYRAARANARGLLGRDRHRRVGECHYYPAVSGVSLSQMRMISAQ
jgi:hypothetical protein